jgi:Fe-S-cluster containining protein
VEPLLVRPGARYECHGDGTCCTNIHVIGPISRSEAGVIRKAARITLPPLKGPAVVHDHGIEALVVAAGRSCVFLNRSGRCRIHAKVGAASKPAACRRFPLGATQTPHGVRVTVSHRCACISMGASGFLQEARAREVLVSPGSGRLERDYTVGTRIRWRARASILFERYVQWERCMIASLDREDGPSIESVLGVRRRDQLPRLRAGSWHAVANSMRAWTQQEPASDGFACALRWAEGAIRHGRAWSGPYPPRPWAWTFDRATKRAVVQRSARVIFGSWLADELWSMVWATRGSAYRAVADLACRYTLATRIAAGLQRVGLRRDAAAGEAIMVLDSVGDWDGWDRVRGRLVEPAAGTLG